jgi:hypothetical protein
MRKTTGGATRGGRELSDATETPHFLHILATADLYTGDNDKWLMGAGEIAEQMRRIGWKL